MQQSADLNEALIFFTVVEAGSMTAAAERLGMQKSTISRKLSAMEERIGVRLLHRSTRRMALTDIGEEHFQRCRYIVEAFQEAENILQHHKSEPSGHLNIVAPIEVGQLVLARQVGEFVQRWPKVSINVELSNRRVDFYEDNIDLALQITPPNDQDLVCRRVWTSEMILVASPDFLKGKTIHHPSDLAELNTIRFYPMIDNTSGWVFSKDGEVYTHIGQGNIIFNNITAIREAAIVGAGLALLPKMILEDALTSGVLVQLFPDWSMPVRHVHAIYPPRKMMPLALRTLLEEFGGTIG
ncbi:LysR family transcriptional regulator [Sansalvadorimonas sp. 2012CJ34-2]|uniref:LysR family transcriptional regulator n=1 Tax=Parendozoicomonas callyspongiae TaxID=2942213 RepID=A0ABT0PJH6_9GAMM|nr:LysR family transcriptional regulator [Sansalvadorimonas sp. 2012CJ34-2]MCL6271518.1 LysR family transcriptional regulator [Sansalvadorimonas sp. 2012CJ34-2]